MPEQPTDANQQQTYRNNKQNPINNRHVATMNENGSTINIPQQAADISLILQQPTDTPQQTGCRSE
jgi:hypothetical protein